MTVLLAVVLMLAVLLLKRPGGVARRFRHAVGSDRVMSFHLAGSKWGGGGAFARDGSLPGASLGGVFSGGGVRAGWLPRLTGRARRAGAGTGGVSMTLVVQQLAALLKGGRTPARLWEELWLVHGGQLNSTARRADLPGKTEQPGWMEEPGRTTRPDVAAARRAGSGLSLASLAMLGAARAAAYRGAPVSDALRISAPKAFPRMEGKELRIWIELAACLDIAEASGCPLADLLTRFAAQLEVEDDAEAARQTALAGPKATVSLLTWLPLMGLGLGIALGVDPLAILLGTPLGLAALAAGVALTVAGRLWSSRLVLAAAGSAVP